MHPPGWYPDPENPSVQRWWDGLRWTEHTRPSSTPTAFGANPAGLSPATPPGLPGAPSGPWGVPPPVASTGSKNGVVIGIVVGIVGLAIVAVMAIAAVTLLGRPATKTTTATTGSNGSSGSSGGGGTTGGTAPKGSSEGTQLEQRARQAGIPVLGAEGTATHTHTLVLLTVDGEEQPIDGGIGIDAKHDQIAAVHTHDDSGVVHVESPTEDDEYTIEQFLTLAGMADDEAICEQYAAGTCTVTIRVRQPNDDLRARFESYGRMPTDATTDDGKHTVLRQGAIIEVEVTSSGES